MRVFTLSVMVLFAVLTAAALVLGLVLLFSGVLAAGLGALALAAVLALMTRSLRKTYRAS